MPRDEHEDVVPDIPRKGRGAVSNRTGRYEAAVRLPVDDGWSHAGDEDDMPPLRTTVATDATRRVITRNDSPDVGFDRSINPYRGCEHGCVYCFARPSHAWLGLSPGLDFETRLFAKHDAAALLDRELRAPGYRCEVIALGVITDAYQPIERGPKITRGILEVLSRFSHPVALITKSALVVRDVDILADMAARADQHLLISKEALDKGKRVATRVAPLVKENRREEIARMLAGAEITREARAAAEQLLKAATA